MGTGLGVCWMSIARSIRFLADMVHTPLPLDAFSKRFLLQISHWPPSILEMSRLTLSWVSRLPFIHRD